MFFAEFSIKHPHSRKYQNNMEKVMHPSKSEMIWGTFIWAIQSFQSPPLESLFSYFTVSIELLSWLLLSLSNPWFLLVGLSFLLLYSLQRAGFLWVHSIFILHWVRCLKYLGIVWKDHFVFWYNRLLRWWKLFWISF